MVTSCTNHFPKKMKYDFVQEISYKSENSYSSLVLEINQDTVLKYHYFDLDSNFLIKDIKHNMRKIIMIVLLFRY
jgi:hypothetical protein